MIRFEVSPTTAAAIVFGLVVLPVFAATLIGGAHWYGVCQ